MRREDMADFQNMVRAYQEYKSGKDPVEAAKDAEHRRRLEWLEALNNSKLYAILAVSPESAVKEIASVDRTKALADLVKEGASPLQILAVAAWDDAELLDALTGLPAAETSLDTAAAVERILEALRKSGDVLGPEWVEHLSDLLRTLLRQNETSATPQANQSAPPAGPISPTACTSCGFDSGEPTDLCPDCGVTMDPPISGASEPSAAPAPQSPERLARPTSDGGVHIPQAAVRVAWRTEVRNLPGMVFKYVDVQSGEWALLRHGDSPIRSLPRGKTIVGRRLLGMGGACLTVTRGMSAFATPLRFYGLGNSEHRLDGFTSATVRVEQSSRLADMIAVRSGTLTDREIGDAIAADVFAKVNQAASLRNSEQLVADPALGRAIAHDLEDWLDEALRRRGLMLVNVQAVVFTPATGGHARNIGPSQPPRTPEDGDRALVGWVAAFLAGVIVGTIVTYAWALSPPWARVLSGAVLAMTAAWVLGLSLLGMGRTVSTMSAAIVSGVVQAALGLLLVAFVFSPDGITTTLPAGLTSTTDGSSVAGQSGPRCKLYLSLEPLGAGTIDVDQQPGPDGKYPCGETVQLTANASRGFEFDRWADGGFASPTRTITLDGDKAVRAIFRLAAPPDSATSNSAP